MKTNNGLIGRAPLHTQAGDVVAVLVGLDNPVVLRPRTGRRYELVGIAFVDGLNWGEALLGDFQHGWSYQRRIYDTDTWMPAFRNVRTDETTLFDPRIDWEQLVVSKTDLRRIQVFFEESGRHFKFPDTEYFLNSGVDLKTIEIV